MVVLVFLRIPMRTRIYLLFLALLPNTCLLNAQSSPTSKPLSVTLLKAGRVLDITSGHYIESVGILIEDDRIKEVGRAAEIQSHAPKDATVIDIGPATVLPGLVDCHTHT
jgi:adenine deaminase